MVNTRPLAPICFSRASATIISITSSIFSISISNNFNALIVEFNSLSSDSVTISFSSDFPSEFNTTVIGNLPTSSLFKP